MNDATGHDYRRTIDFVVAAWGPAFGYPEMPVFDGEQFTDQGPEVPYDERRKVVVRVPGDTTLGSVIDEAARCFGVRSQHGRAISDQVHCVAWRQDGDELGMEYEYERWLRAVRLVDSDGAPSWAVRWSAITVDELLAAARAGLVEGDPLRPYFWPVIAQGELEDLVQALWTTWMRWEEVLPHVVAGGATIGAVGAALRQALRLIRRARDATGKDHESWRRALERPAEFFAYLDGTPRTTAEIVRTTSLTEDQVVGGLPSLGYILGPDARWRLGTEGVAEAMQLSVLDISQRGRGPTVEEAAERVRRLVEGIDTRSDH